MKTHIRTLILLIVLAGFAGAPALGQTRTINVDPIADNNPAGGCTLREAIDLANAGAGAGGHSNGCTVAESGGGAVAYVLNLPAYTYTLTGASGENFNATGDLDIRNPANVTINGVTATSTIIDGGGIDRVFNILGASATFNDVTITNGTVGNDTGGGIQLAFSGTGMVTVNNSTISGNTAQRGGGLQVAATTSATVTNSTISGNSVTHFGGGIQNNGTVTVTNSTISGNSAGYNDAGFANFSTATITHTTISNNTHRGLGSYGTTTLINSIVADQASGNDCAGSITSNGYNVDSDGSCGLTATGDVSNANALLGSLQDNGGPTRTHALLTGSPAINRVPNGVNGCGTDLTSDQRGEARPDQAGAPCDSGSFENPPDPHLVTNTNDSGPGSLRTAIEFANSNGDFGTISFSIAGAGPHVIAPGSPLPAVTSPVAIDGATQPGNSGVCSAGIASRPAYKVVLQGGSGAGLKLAAGSGGSTIRGLNIRNFTYGVEIDASSGNTVECNFIGTNETGTAAAGNANGVYIQNGASSNTISGNLISGNSSDGAKIRNSGTSDNTVRDNFIGTQANGTAALGNGASGVFIQLGAAGNAISNNSIAFNAGDGVGILDAGSTGNAIRGNSLFENGQQGIDLSLDGPSANDAGDGDGDANRRQNFPHVTSAEIDGDGNLVFSFRVDTNPANATYPLTIDFFKADAAQEEGRTRFTTTTYAVGDHPGNKEVNLGSAAGLGVSVGDIIVSTATDAAGNTSEFSGPKEVQITATASIGDLVWNDRDGDKVPDPGEPGIDGVTIRLIHDLNENHIIEPGEPLVGTQTTSGGGFYDFTELVAGGYIIDVTDTSSMLAGFVPTNRSNRFSVDLTDGEDYNWADMGYRQKNASIGDVVWNDLNGNGTHDGGEPGLDGVTIDLIDDANGNGQIDSGESVLATQTTSDGGAYDFTALFAGTYLVDITDTDSVLAGLMISSGTDPKAVTLAAGQDLDDADFGYQGVGSITIIKEALPEDDTVFNYNETITGGTFALMDPSDNTKVFANIFAGSYTVTETAPSGWTLDAIECTGDTDSGSVMDVPGGSVTIDLDAGETITCTFAKYGVDLGVVITESADPVEAGSGAGNLVYIVTVTNHGTAQATGVVLDGAPTRPAGVTVDSIVVSAGTRSQRTWTLGSLAAGASETLTATMTVTASAAEGTDVIGLMMGVTSLDQSDINAGNNSASVATSVTVPTVDLGVVITESADPVEAGSGASNLVYTVTVTNHGTAQATGIVLDGVPTRPAGVNVDGIVVSAGTRTQRTWTLGSLAAGASETLTATMTVTASAAEGTDVIGLMMGVTSLDQPDINADNNSASVATSVTGSTANARMADQAQMAETLSEAASVPEEFALSSNYPNPFNPETTVPFALPEASDVTIIVYDVMGRRVAVLVEGRLSAGHHEVRWQADGFPSGMYLVRMQANGFSQTRRMTLVK